MLSIVANTIPFCNYNQSPRNMYQCQMAKQTMGTPYHSHAYRMDNKVYRLLFPQAPLVRTERFNEYDFGQNPSGANAVVAVISYTGYDMEDAMIINKGAYDRGFGHGTVYKSYLRDLNEGQSQGRSKFRLIR
jgi:DNA-directed RNA polymerase I subunit RPA2